MAPDAKHSSLLDTFINKLRRKWSAVNMALGDKHSSSFGKFINNFSRKLSAVEFVPWWHTLQLIIQGGIDTENSLKSNIERQCLLKVGVSFIHVLDSFSGQGPVL